MHCIYVRTAGRVREGVNTPRVNLVHGLRDPFGQIVTGQVHILPCRLQVLVTGKPCNLMQLQARASEVGQAKMTQRRVRECRNIRTKRDGSHYL
jgi:hypothetical protein